MQVIYNSSCLLEEKISKKIMDIPTILEDNEVKKDIITKKIMDKAEVTQKQNYKLRRYNHVLELKLPTCITNGIKNQDLY